MTDVAEAFEGILALAIGGVIFVTFASAVDAPLFIDFRFWGVLYILAAIGLAVVLTAAAARAILN